MGCCCKKVDPNKEKTCCVCNPFDQDGFLLTAQITSIVATLISWVWWPLFVISASIVTLLQTTWCCKMKKAGLIGASVLSFSAFVGALFVGIWMATECWDTVFVVNMNQDDDRYYWYHNRDWNDDHYRKRHERWVCYHSTDNPSAWTGVAFVVCALWLITFVSTTYFICYRYDSKAAKWASAQCVDEADADEEVVVPVVEMGVIPPAPASTPAPHATATVVPSNEKELDHA